MSEDRVARWLHAMRRDPLGSELARRPVILSAARRRKAGQVVAQPNPSSLACTAFTSGGRGSPRMSSAVRHAPRAAASSPMAWWGAHVYQYVGLVSPVAELVEQVQVTPVAGEGLARPRGYRCAALLLRYGCWSGTSLRLMELMQ